MFKTYLIDGDKGGVGKSLATRALVHYFLSLPEEQRPVLAVFDADMSNPDVCGTGGLSRNNTELAQAEIIDLSVEYGWISFANALADLTKDTCDEELRIIVNMPAQIGPRAFRGDMPLVSDVLREAHALPVWLLSRTDESIRTLEQRINAMPQRFGTGLALRNLFFGAADKFQRWQASELRKQIVENGNWIEASFPEINDEVISRIGRTPFHVALEEGLDGKSLPYGYRLVLNSWLRTARSVFDMLEQLQLPGE